MAMWSVCSGSYNDITNVDSITNVDTITNVHK